MITIEQVEQQSEPIQEPTILGEGKELIEKNQPAQTIVAEEEQLTPDEDEPQPTTYNPPPQEEHIRNETKLDQNEDEEESAQTETNFWIFLKIIEN